MTFRPISSSLNRLLSKTGAVRASLFLSFLGIIGELHIAHEVPGFLQGGV